ncbi:MAG: hypothetical protein GY714_03135 [Desulfobacterales bacterium]|nr:hypothetical protein [Desulfobacterales bacterium]
MSELKTRNTFYILKKNISQNIILSLMILMLVSCSAKHRGPDAPPPSQLPKNYIDGLSKVYQDTNAEELKLALMNVLTEMSFSFNDVNTKELVFAITTNHIESDLNMNKCQSGSLGLVSLYIICKKSDLGLNLSIKYCLAKSCIHCPKWEESCFFHEILHKQVQKIIQKIYNKISQYLTLKDEV